MQVVQERLERGEVSGTPEQLQRQWFLVGQQLSKATDNLSLLEIRLNKTKNSVKDFAIEMVYAEWAVRRAQDTFARDFTDNPNGIWGSRDQLIKVLKEERDLRLNGEDLTAAEILHIGQEYAYAKLNIEKDANEKYKDIMQSHSDDITGIVSDTHKEMQKIIGYGHKRMTDRIKQNDKDWVGSVKFNVGQVKKEYEELGKTLEKNAKIYTTMSSKFEDSFGEFFTGDLEGVSVDNQTTTLLAKLFSVRKVRENVGEVVKAQTELREHLVTQTQLTEKEREDIMQAANDRIGQQWTAQLEAWKEYNQKRIDVHKKAQDKITKYDLEKNVRIDKIYYDMLAKGEEGKAKELKFEQESQEKGHKYFVDANNRRKKALEKHVKEVYNVHKKVSKRLSSEFIDVILQERTLQEALKRFIRYSLKVIAQDFIETNFKIVNQKRVQAEIGRTNAMKLQGGNMLMGQIEQLSGLANFLQSSLGGAGVALGGASALAPTEFGNTITGFMSSLSQLGGKIGTIPDRLFGVFDDPSNDRMAGAYGSKMGSDFAMDQIKRSATRSAQDQQNYFNQNFKNALDNIVSRAEGASGGNSNFKPNININVYLDSKDLAKEVKWEIDAQIQEGRLN